MEERVSQPSPEGLPAPPKAGLQWQWVFMSIVVGTMLVSVIVAVTSSVFRNPFVPTLIGSLGFVVTGIIIGYFSPGVTIREPAIAGAMLVLIASVVLYAGFDFNLTWFQSLSAIGFGYVLSLLGAWIGEALQGTVAARTYGVQWKWVSVGITVGFVLNNFFVFLFAPLFHIDLKAVLVSFLVSFIITGFIIGYKSPGVTIKEAAIAGILTVVLDWLMVNIGFRIAVPMVYLVLTLAAGYFLAMTGAWLGEKFQESMERTRA